jgi:N-terminal acetyltransferase 2
MRKLSREYGWSALGVYFALSALDLPFCFLGVRMLGVDRIGHYEHVVLEAFWNVVHIPFPNLGKGKGAAGAVSGGQEEGSAAGVAREDQLGWSGAVEAAEERNKGAEACKWP